MKKLTIIFAYFLFSIPFISRAENANAADVNVRVNTPAGQVEINRPPPPPVVVVPPPAPQKIVVEKQAPPPPPAAAEPAGGSCHCSLMPSNASALGYLSLTPIFSLLFFWRTIALSKNRKYEKPRA